MYSSSGPEYDEYESNLWNVTWIHRVTGTKEAPRLVIHELQVESTQTAQHKHKSEDHKCEQKTISWPTQNANENWRELAMNGNLTPENNILTLIQHVYILSLMLLAWATTHHLLKCARQSGEVRRCSQISNDDSSIVWHRLMERGMNQAWGSAHLDSGHVLNTQAIPKWLKWDPGMMSK